MERRHVRARKVSERVGAFDETDRSQAIVARLDALESDQVEIELAGSEGSDEEFLVGDGIGGDSEGSDADALAVTLGGKKKKKKRKTGSGGGGGSVRKTRGMLAERAREPRTFRDWLEESGLLEGAAADGGGGGGAGAEGGGAAGGAGGLQHGALGAVIGRGGSVPPGGLGAGGGGRSRARGGPPGASYAELSDDDDDFFLRDDDDDKQATADAKKKKKMHSNGKKDVGVRGPFLDRLGSEHGPAGGAIDRSTNPHHADRPDAHPPRGPGDPAGPTGAAATAIPPPGSPPSEASTVPPAREGDYLRAAAPPQAIGARRRFCSVCGAAARYSCSRCGSHYCSLRCSTIHLETRCLKNVS